MSSGAFRRPVRRTAVAGLLVSAFVASVASVAAAEDRTSERLLYRCTNEFGRRDVTLYASGAVRLRQGLWESQEMYLDELTPEELTSYLAQLDELAAEAAAASGSFPAEAPDGEWVESCELRLALPGAEPWSYRFSPYATPPLAVANLLHVAEDLAEHTRPPVPAERLPADYEPRPGDILRTAEGERFRVVRRTLDQKGLELQGIDTPLVIFVALDDLATAFAAVDEPGAAPAKP